MSRQIRVGLLVLAGVALFLIGLFAIANRAFLFSDTFYVKSRFNNVAGLLSGAAVQYQGVNVGRVESVRLPSEPGGKIEVLMAIRERARPLVRDNTQAQVQSEGLVGNMIIVLVSPPEPGGDIAEGEYIPGVDPFDLTQVTDRVLTSVERFEQTAGVFEQIMLDVRNGEGTVGKFVYDPALYNSLVQTATETQQLMANLGNEAQKFVGIADRVSGGVNDILAKVNEGEGTMAKMLNDPGVYNTLLAASDTLLTISGDLRAITNSAENMTNWGALGAYRFAELMEAAKHNWLFKRYFEQRGYMEQADFEVREQALSETYKTLEAQRRQLFEWEQRLEAQQEQLEALGIRTQPGEDTSEDASALPTPAGSDGQEER